MAAEDRIGAAYHEAGHAIVLWVFGLQVDSVAIGIAGDDAAGHTMIMGSDEHLSEFDRIVISEAGLEAQEVFEAPTHDHAGLADYAKIIDILGDISAEESLKIRTAARERAREIILANRSKVARLAEYLIENGRISGFAFLELMGVGSVFQNERGVQCWARLKASGMAITGTAAERRK
jgi:ATP-dependent Zn protease